MNDLDDLLTRDPLSLTKPDLDAIVAYYRAQRSRKAAGEKSIKPKVDLSTALASLIKPKPTGEPIKRRI